MSNFLLSWDVSLVVDAETFDRFNMAQQHAKEQGLALVEALDFRRLLLTRDREHAIVLSAMEDIQRRLDRQSANKILSFYYGRTDGTAAEMFEALKQWLEAVCRNYAQNTLEEL